MTTLKIRDLSIGDWVDYCGRHYKVYSIEDCGFIRAKCEDDYTSSHIGKNIDYLEPIPITAEILEKNGWSRKNSYGWYLFSDKYIRINIWFDKDRWDVEVSSEDRRVTYADITGRGTLHTHQLQHALRLAGGDKEINL